MDTPDSGHIVDSETQVEIADLDMSSGTAPARFTGRRLSFRVRIGMGIAILAAVALLGVVVLRSVLPLPEAAKASLPPQIHYPLSLTVVDGTGYAITTNGIVSAFRVSNGALLWHRTVRNVGEETITVADGVVYLVPSVLYNSFAMTAPLVALRAADGSPLWSRAFPWDSRTPFQLTVANGFVYIRTAADTIEVLRAADGSQLWQYNAPPSFLTTIADGMVYVLAQEGQLTALRASTGLQAWAYNSHAPPEEDLPPVVADGMVFLSLQSGGMDVLRAGTGALLWRYSPHVPALALWPQTLIANGVVYALTQDGHLLALHADTGSPIWNVELRVSNPLPPQFVIGEAVYVETLDSGNVEALRTSDGSVLWHYQGREGEQVPWTFTQSVIYLASPAPGVSMIGSITALRTSDGSALWHYSPSIPATQFIPTLTGNLVVIALQDGNITTLSASSGSLRWHRYVAG